MWLTSIVFFFKASCYDGTRINHATVYSSVLKSALMVEVFNFISPNRQHKNVYTARKKRRNCSTNVNIAIFKRLLSTQQSSDLCQATKHAVTYFHLRVPGGACVLHTMNTEHIQHA